LDDPDIRIATRFTSIGFLPSTHHSQKRNFRMTGAQFDIALRRDRQAVMAALVILTALAWGAMLRLARDIAMQNATSAIPASM
jgi:hypothetical protein